jgi:phage shock protein PspC (stress-responsive transcriptional regulator)
MNTIKTFLQGKKKILTAIIGVLSGLAIIFGVDQNEVSTISGALVSIVSVAGYLIAEGKIDVERIKNAANDVNAAIDVLDNDAEGGEKNG